MDRNTQMVKGIMNQEIIDSIIEAAKNKADELLMCRDKVANRKSELAILEARQAALTKELEAHAEFLNQHAKDKIPRMKFRSGPAKNWQTHFHI